MQVSHYGLTRPAAIAAKVAALVAGLATEAPAVETDVAEATALESLTAPEVVAEVEPSVPFVSRFPHLVDQHLKAQRRMWAAIKGAELPSDIALRLAGINALLGTSFTSSRALSPDDLYAVAAAIEARRFSGAWQLDAEAALPFDDAPLPDAPPETDGAPESVGTPAPLEALDEIAMEFDLFQMREANRARALNALRSERVLLETRLRAVDHAILCA